MSKGKFTFPRGLMTSLPRGVARCVSTRSGSRVAEISHSITTSFLIRLAGNSKLVFSSRKNFLKGRGVRLDVSRGACECVQRRFPSSLGVCFSSCDVRK